MKDFLKTFLLALKIVALFILGCILMWLVVIGMMWLTMHAAWAILVIGLFLLFVVAFCIADGMRHPK
jgi:hypothetical protein